MSARKINVPEKQKERDPDFINAEVALKRAAQKARQRAGQAGIGVIVVEDGKIVEEWPDRSRWPNMKIQTIEIRNYKAFYGNYKIEVGGKNLFIYGENSSGKSSLYYALKDFFQSTIEDIDLHELENVFLKKDEKGNTEIKVIFKPNSKGQKNKKSYWFSTTANDTRIPTDTSIRDANKLKSFLTYKHLLGVHHLKKDDQINLFDLLVRGVLKHFRYSLTGGKELGELWGVVEFCVAKPTERGYRIDVKQRQLNAALKIFNSAFGELFKDNSPE
jgi:hypothetical protein